jgi:hypothetical protein
MDRVLPAALLLLVALANPVPVVAQSEDCSIQYFLTNDTNYWSSGRYTITAECERLLLPELRALSEPTVEQRYIVAMFLASHDRLRAEGAEMYRRLCEVDDYPRACMGYLSASTYPLAELPESEAWRFTERAARKDVPAALYAVGRRHALKYKETGETAELCLAIRYWRRAVDLGDLSVRGHVEYAIGVASGRCDQT